MNALEWLRTKATKSETYDLAISAEDAAANECEPGTYTVTRWHFAGRIPNRMVFELRKLTGALVVTDTENEVLRVGGQYRSDFNKCEFFRTTYERKAA